MLQVSRVFTGIAFSSSFTLRQFSSRYTIHALQNLPEKELRYLWTIIVIADIDEGFARSAAHSAVGTVGSSRQGGICSNVGAVFKQSEHLKQFEQFKQCCARPANLTFSHRSGLTPYTCSYEFAGSCVFGKQSPEILSLRATPLHSSGILNSEFRILNK